LPGVQGVEEGGQQKSFRGGLGRGSQGNFSERTGGFGREQERKDKRTVAGRPLFAQPRAALFPAAEDGARRGREQRGLHGMADELRPAGVRKKMPHGLLAADEGLLHGAGMNGGLEKRGAGRGETFEVRFERAAFGVA
jgi:hypothetical protein